MPEIIDVVLESKNIIVYFDDNTRVSGRLSINRLGNPRIEGIGNELRSKLIDYYKRSKPSTKSDIRFLSYTEGFESLSAFEHATVDHTNISTVTGGATSGEIRRAYFPLLNAKVDGGLTTITGSSDPKIAGPIATNRHRIVWEPGDTGEVQLELGIPFEDIDSSKSVVLDFKIALGQSGTEIVESAPDFSVQWEGGGFSIGFTIGQDFTASVGPTVRTWGGLTIGASFDILDIKHVLMSFKPDVAPTTDDLYLYSAWVEYTLK